MAKAPIETVENLQNEPSALGVINENFQVLSDAVERSLSRGNEDPAPANEMNMTLDMNNQRIINLPPPVSYTEPARHGQLQQYVDEVTEMRDEVIVMHDNVEVLHGEVDTLHEEVFKRFLGVFAADPTEDQFGNPLTEGAIYFNSVTRAWRVYNIRTVYADEEPVYVGDDLVEVHQWEELPRGTLNTLGDVNGLSVAHNDILRWNNGTQTWEPIELSGENATYDNTESQLNATDIQAALDEIVDKSMVNSYDLAFFLEGIPVDGEIALKVVAGRPFIVPAGMLGTVAHANVGAAAAHTWTVQKNGTNVGTVNWALGAQTATFTQAADQTYEVGDILTITVPNPADTNLRDIAMTLRAWRP